jgi:hypothetical protein
MVIMVKPFAIFWFGENGPNWIDTAGTLKAATERIAKLPAANSGSYSVLDLRTSTRVPLVDKSRAAGLKTQSGR